jgi:hypothetical protein
MTSVSFRTGAAQPPQHRQRQPRRRAGLPVPRMAPAYLAPRAADAPPRSSGHVPPGRPPRRPPAQAPNPIRHRGGGVLAAAVRRPVTRLYLALAATWLAFGAGLASDRADERRLRAAVPPGPTTARRGTEPRRRPDRVTWPEVAALAAGYAVLLLACAGLANPVLS